MTKPKDIDDEIREFRVRYYEQMDLGYWQDRIFTAYRRYDKLKKPENKARYIVDIYSIYLQLSEILLIHMHTLSKKEDVFLHTLAINNQEIQQFGAEIAEVKNREYLKKFIDNYVYKMRGDKFEDKESRINTDAALLLESIDGYLKTHDFLNSYKHGYRLTSNHGHNSLYAKPPGGQRVTIFEGDSQLTYYRVKRKGKGIDHIEEVQFAFNIDRVFGRALFLVTLLENIRIALLKILGSPKAPNKYPYFYIGDKDTWNKSFGTYEFKRVLFQYNPPDKDEKK